MPGVPFVALQLLLFNLLLIDHSKGAPLCSYRSPSSDEVIKSPRLLRSSRKPRSLTENFHIHSVIDQSNVLIPNATQFWTQNLRLRNSGINGILLERACIVGSTYTLNDRRVCTLGCAAETKCGEAIIPEYHLHKCLSRTRSTEHERSIRPVLTNFILYVSAVNSTRCRDVNTVAYAVHCQQESTNRPIAGNVNICPNALSTRPHDQELLISTIKHEIAHALVFSDALFPDFPSNPIKTFERDWPLKNGQVVKRRHHVVTSKRVVEEVRRHFNCSSLLGAELEDQGGFGTSLVHWEKRLFENEAMTGTHTQDPIYSRITLALFEDSGWYDVSYDAAEVLDFGRNLGCDFAKMTCGEWIRKQNKRGLPIAPYCQLPKHDGKRSLAVTRCSSARNALSFCNLVPYKLELVPYYQYFDRLSGIASSQIAFYGGSVELADFCPFYQAFTWRDQHSENPLHRDSRCELEMNMPTEESNTVLEIYGQNSRCFDLSISWTERRCSRVKTYTQYMAGCYEYSCHDGRLNIGVANSTDFYPCYHTGQKIYIRRIINGWLKEGSIVCPSCTEICGSIRNRGNGSCLPEIEPPFGYVGDLPLVEPCFAFGSSPLNPIIIVLFLLPSASRVLADFHIFTT
ncbi:hypothetical protein M3Y96_00825600 [Aphelenchoides besseyi]|nr:hypothetical protein M3Y96_00825600 [Aphelenchoides besseyi]